MANTSIQIEEPSIQIEEPLFSPFTEEMAMLQARKLHVVCEASQRVGGKALRYMTDALSIDRDQAIKFIQAVNQTKNAAGKSGEECASLHPKYAFSMFPEIPLANPGEGCEERFIPFLQELIFEANESMVKAATMLFAFDGDNAPGIDWFKDMVRMTIARARETAGRELTSLRTIWVFP